MTQVFRPPGDPIGDCPVCGQPYYEYDEQSTCMGQIGLGPDLDDDDYCSRTGRNYYITEYYLHVRDIDD